VHRPFWQGLLDWFRDRLVAEGMINAEDLDLVQVIDEPEEVVEAIFKHYERAASSPCRIAATSGEHHAPHPDRPVAGRCRCPPSPSSPRTSSRFPSRRRCPPRARPTSPR
jgi:hypothetical protein